MDNQVYFLTQYAQTLPKMFFQHNCKPYNIVTSSNLFTPVSPIHTMYCKWQEGHCNASSQELLD